MSIFNHNISGDWWIVSRLTFFKPVSKQHWHVHMYFEGVFCSCSFLSEKITNKIQMWEMWEKIHNFLFLHQSLQCSSARKQGRSWNMVLKETRFLILYLDLSDWDCWHLIISSAQLWFSVKKCRFHCHNLICEMQGGWYSWDFSKSAVCDKE